MSDSLQPIWGSGRERSSVVSVSVHDEETQETRATLSNGQDSCRSRTDIDCSVLITSSSIGLSENRLLATVTMDVAKQQFTLTKTAITGLGFPGPGIIYLTGWQSRSAHGLSAHAGWPDHRFLTGHQKICRPQRSVRIPLCPDPRERALHQSGFSRHAES